jgi:hypothetical protein
MELTELDAAVVTWGSFDAVSQPVIARIVRTTRERRNPARIFRS